ncbi:MAG: hypothetical protein ABFD90_06770 [Phycisphaerales bacterium]
MVKRSMMVFVAFVAVGAVATYGFVHLCRTSPAFYGSVVGTYELPEGKIRLAFRQITGRELPTVVRNARGILFGGREARIFVRFETDADGIACIERKYDIPQARRETLEGTRLAGLVASGWTGFPAVEGWQEKTGRRMFDPNAFGAGRMISYSSQGGEGWEVYIDDEHGTVYVYTWAYT